MGLDFNHSEAHWSYSGFNRARTRLVAILGYDFDVLCDHGTPAPQALLDDAIAPLIFHSDCDGEISPEHCATTAPRLRELVSVWPEDDFDRQQFELLAGGMDDAAAGNTPLEFK